MSWAANTPASSSTDSGSGAQASHSRDSPSSRPTASSANPPIPRPRRSFVPGEQVYTTNEGPVVITTRGKLVFVAESFPLDLARKLTALILDAQGTGEMRLAQAAQPGGSAQDSRAWSR